MELEELGWDSGWVSELDARRASFPALQLEPGRVMRQDRGWLRVATASGERLAQLSGKLTHSAESAVELPAVGDWIALSQAAKESTVHAVLTRRTLLARRMAGSEFEGQAIAANVDVAFLVQGLDQAPNLRRIERALAMIAASGAEPVVVLNKADLAADAARAVSDVAAVAKGAQVLAVSAELAQGLDAFLGRLPRGRTGVLLGPSGAGKSSLVNRLLGEARLATGAVRAGDSKGRHTTTFRELVRLPSGALLIDGPGVREFGLVEGELAETFPEIELLATQCRFRDCLHAREPGCAVRAAVERGELDAARFDNFQRLGREIKGGAQTMRPARKGPSGKPKRR